MQHGFTIYDPFSNKAKAAITKTITITTTKTTTMVMVMAQRRRDAKANKDWKESQSDDGGFSCCCSELHVLPANNQSGETTDSTISPSNKRRCSNGYI